MKKTQWPGYGYKYVCANRADTRKHNEPECRVDYETAVVKHNLGMGLGGAEDKNVFNV